MEPPLLNPLRFPAPLALVLLVLVLVTLAPAWVALHLTVSNSAEAYTPPQSSAAVFERQLRERFPVDEVLVAAFQAEAIFEDEFLAGLEALVSAMEKHPLVDRVLAPSTVDHIRGTEDGFLVEPLLDAGVRAELSPAERRDRLLADRFAPGFLVSTEGDLIALAVRPEPLEDSLQRRSIYQAFHSEVQRAGLEDSLVAVSGQTALDVAQLQATLRGTWIFVPGTMFIGLVLIGWLFRRWIAVAVAVTVIGSSVGTALAVLVILGQPFTLITAILPPLMVALSVALLIHWFNALALAAQRGMTGESRASWAWQAIHKPALFTALTTAAGLISLSISTIPPIRALGQAAAVGVLLQYVVVVWLLPPIFARWDSGTWMHSRQGIGLLNGGVRWFRDLGMRRPVWVLAGSALVLVLGVPQIAHVQVETDLFRFFKEDHPVTQANRLFLERLSGVTALEVVFEAPERDGFTQIEGLRQVESFRNWAAERPQVDRVVSMVDVIEEMHWGFHEEDPEYRVLPHDSALIAQYLFIYDGRDLYELVDRDLQVTRVLLNLNVSGAQAINAFIAEIDAQLAATELGETSFRIAGFGRLFGDQERLLIQGQVLGLATAVVLIFLLLTVLWRSVSASLLCMVPNIAPVILIFVVMGVFGLWLDMATAMIAGVAVGIAVDDTIHVFQGYRSRRLAGRSHVLALARTYQHAGRAVTATTLILVAQFIVLTASEFVPIVEFGLLTAVGLLTALVFDLLVLPALLSVTAGWWVAENSRKGDRSI